MAKIKLTKGELKRHRDALRQYQRYLPTLQLKKQQLQLEVLRQLASLEVKKASERLKSEGIIAWAGLLTDADIRAWVKPQQIISEAKNIAGLDIPVFEHVEFMAAEYDLFLSPLWQDAAIEALRQLVSLRLEISVIEKALDLLRRELRISTQRVNLFEKVKIPEAEEAIRLIKIYIGDQMTNAVGRSKIAKRKIEQAVLVEVAA